MKLLLLLLSIGVLLVGATAVGAPATVVIPPRSTIIRSGEAVTDSTAAAAPAAADAARGGGVVIKSGEATMYSWYGGAPADAWYNRPIPDHRRPARTDRYLRADTMWLMVYLYTYNQRFGCPLGPDHSNRFRSWRPDDDGSNVPAGDQKRLEEVQPDR